MIAKAETKSFIFFQVEWSVIFVILTYIFIGKYGFIDTTNLVTNELEIIDTLPVVEGAE